MIPNIRTIAVTDPSSGAGIQVDLKTFSALGACGVSAITALVAQNTRGVRWFQVAGARFVADDVDAVYDDLRIDAGNIGTVATAERAAPIAGRLLHHRARNIVLDPDIVAKSCDRPLAEGEPRSAVEALPRGRATVGKSVLRRCP
jgi:hydroxymethylpyrimidine/phosphomethylpyrimidine kinase